MDDAKLHCCSTAPRSATCSLRYATGLDSRDWPLFRSCFDDEIETDFTSVFGGDPRRLSADRWTEAAAARSAAFRRPAHDHEIM